MILRRIERLIQNVSGRRFKRSLWCQWKAARIRETREDNSTKFVCTSRCYPVMYHVKIGLSHSNLQCGLQNDLLTREREDFCIRKVLWRLVTPIHSERIIVASPKPFNLWACIAFRTNICFQSRYISKSFSLHYRLENAREICCYDTEYNFFNRISSSLSITDISIF